MKHVQFVSRPVAESSLPREHWGIISITEPDSTQANLQGDWAEILRLEFHDVDAPTDDYRVMTIEHARQIVVFVDRVKDDIDVMIIHCRAGMSRSAAVARWIAEHYDLPFNFNYMIYNRHVYRLLREAAEGK